MAGSPTNLSKSKVSFHLRILFADLVHVGQDPYFSYPKQPGMFIPDGSRNQQQQKENLLSYLFKFHDFFLVFLNRYRQLWKKYFLAKILLLSSQKYGLGIRDPGSEIRDPENTYHGPYPVSKKSPDPDPQH
jgi:hypothetical protein